jgi:hypothetical protein
VLKVRGKALDQSYMQELASIMNVDDLLQRALRDAGLVPS